MSAFDLLKEHYEKNMGKKDSQKLYDYYFEHVEGKGDPQARPDGPFGAAEEKLLTAHMKEAEGKNKADVTNLGWSSGDDYIHSKTTVGHLYSEINEDGNITQKKIHTYSKEGKQE